MAKETKTKNVKPKATEPHELETEATAPKEPEGLKEPVKEPVGLKEPVAVDATDAKKPDAIELDLMELGNEANLLASTGVAVLLRFGVAGSYREIQMQNVAREVKRRASVR